MYDNPQLIDLIQALGYLGIFGVVFSESGLFLGLFLPADSVLFVSGLLAAQGYFNIWIVLIICFLAAVLGDNFGYMLGARFGMPFIQKSRYISEQSYNKAKRFYDENGSITVFLARFIPVLSTLAPFFAGIAKMKYGTFFVYNIAGGLVWTSMLVLAGYYLPRLAPGVKVFFPIVYILITIISLLPLLKKRQSK